MKGAWLCVLSVIVSSSLAGQSAADATDDSEASSTPLGI